MSYRAKRYVDSRDFLTKHAKPQFATTYDFPFARRAMTTDIATIRLYLQQELSRNSRYHKVWQNSLELFKKKRSLLLSQTKKPLPEECHIAVIAYTFESAPLRDGTTLEVYVEFNKLTREMKSEASWKAFPYKSLYCLLAQAIGGVQSVPDNNKPPYYRGVSFHYGEDFPHEEILVDFSQFTSCSTSKEKALDFIRMKGGKGTLIILPYPPMAGIGIKNHSQYATEEEVLICPWSTFTIRWCKQEGNVHEIVLTSEGPYFDHLTYTANKPEDSSISFMGGLKNVFGW